MFLLTEGTLFFRDLALDARVYDEKPSLCTVVQTWVDGVAAAAASSDDLVDVAQTSTGASSTLYSPSLVCLSATPGQRSPTSGHVVACESMAQSASAFSKTSFLVDYEGGETAMSECDKASVAMSGMIMSSPSDRGNDYCNLDMNASLFQRQQEASRGVKRKADDTNIESNTNADYDMNLEEPVPQYIRQVGNLTSGSAKYLPRKRFKHKYTLVPFLSAYPEPALRCVAATYVPGRQTLQRRLVDNEGYIVEVIKRHSEYETKDLPVPHDRRWTRSFLSTAILWYSVQENIWNVPEMELASALQRIFSIVYPDTKYRVTPAGSVFALTLQRINEWRSSFSSSALAMMHHFFSSLDDHGDVYTAAEFLATDFRFLRADPDSSEPTEPFRSPFLLILLAITHLGSVATCVDVPGWDTRAMAAGMGGEGVIALASAALERALIFIRSNTLDVEHVLADTAPSRVDGDGALPKTMTVLDTLTARDAPPASQFSSAHWASPTAAYREAVRHRGPAFVQGTFAAALAKRRKIVPASGADDEDGEDMVRDLDWDCASNVDAGVPVPDPRALL